MDDPTIPLLIVLSILLVLCSAAIVYLVIRLRALHKRVSEADIRQMVDMGEEKGEIEKEEKELIENVFEFNNSTAADVMIHRTDVVMLWVDDPQEEIMETIRSLPQVGCHLMPSQAATAASLMASTEQNHCSVAR